jgi:hypothetical protein
MLSISWLQERVRRNAGTGRRRTNRTLRKRVLLDEETPCLSIVHLESCSRGRLIERVEIAEDGLDIRLRTDGLAGVVREFGVDARATA